MKPLYRFTMLLTTFSLTAFGLATLISCSSVHSEEPVTKEKRSTNPDNDNYWTPERLKEAKPLEVPTPTEPAPRTPSSPDLSPSIDAPGHGGDEDIPPDNTNHILEN